MKSLATAFTCALLLTAVAPASADTWTVDPEASKLSFEVQQGEGTLNGEFQSWQASIDFDVEAPGSAKISAVINPASAATGNPQFDTTLPAKDWFDTEGFPDAEFAAEGASLVEGNSYKADGTLTIKGVSHPVVLEFTLEIEGDTAKAQGTATLNRLEYAIGAGVGTDTVGDVVTVTLDLTATR
ncbi:YceI family protein [Roseibium sp. HPY-6]|uniref:YceI family protein n=1 Tax=Roseibium sp. HPY-6 TaxID=3229852 RepID=UPI00338E71CF